VKRLTAAFRFIIDYFEHGDLVPFIVVVSAIHYSAILREHDHLIAAVSIGTLVDLGHYRWTKAAVKYSGENKWERTGRWVMVLVMSAIALNYQQRFYNDWWLSVPMPLLIASLAWLNQKEGKGKPAISQEKPAKSQLIEIDHPQIPAKAEPTFLTCELCGATRGKSGNLFITQAALNAHMKAHKAAAQPVNGTGRKEA
jgi:hypothetical protein